MPRAQNSHAYVNAGFLLQTNDKRDRAIKATIVYGGIRPEVSALLLREKSWKNLIIFNFFSSFTRQS